ncbi:MAG: hypothetical protein H6811_11975 [Phycisphaeraceae bacterium]|nr:hypothetical protein [Phycisphaeraceae bacterium]
MIAACALLVAAMAPAPLAPGEAISMEFRLFMIEPARPESEPTPVLVGIPLLRSYFTSRLEAQPLDRRTGVSIDGQRWDFTGEAPPSVVMLSAPRIVAAPGQSATITIGTSAQYLEPAEDGLFRLVDSESFEGVEISVRPKIDGEGVISLEPLEVRLSQVAERAPVTGLPFDVGRPTIRTVETRTSLRLSGPMIVPLGDAPGRAGSLGILVSAETIE